MIVRKLAFGGAIALCLFAQAASAEVILTWSNDQLSFHLGKDVGLLISEREENVNVALDKFMKDGFAIAMTKGWGLPLAPKKGAVLIELVKDSKRVLVIQRYYSGVTSVIEVTSPATRVVMQGL
jgi:hypothetical protein